MADAETPKTIEDPLAHFDEAILGELRHNMEWSQWLTEKAMHFARWAPYVDWSLRLRGEGATQNERLLEAFHDVRRFDFLSDEGKPKNLDDNPIGIGYKQTNSQPSTVAKMIDWLDPQPYDKVLDVGFGSGWTTGLLAHMVGESGAVYGTERVEELCEFAEGNLAKYAFSQVDLQHTPDSLGLPEEAPYDRILVSAGTPESWLPELSSQLSPDGGIMVLPVVRDITTHQDEKHNKQLCAIRRQGDEQEVLRCEDGYAFVPLLRGDQ